MRKRLLLTLLIPILLFTGCRTGTIKKENHCEKATKNLFKQIENDNFLYYDTKTKVVYIVFRETKNGGQRIGTGYGYMSPYYAPNGKPYRYIDGELKEIEE